jgi:hypothetical protein
VAAARVALTTGALAVAIPLWIASPTRPDDALIAMRAGDALLGGDWAVFAHHPDAQMGPLPLLLSGALPWRVFSALIGASLGAFIWLAGRLGTPERALWWIGVPLALPWSLFALQGHADDALVLLGAVVMLVGLRDHRTVAIVGGFALAAAGKPTAAILVGLLLVAGWRVAAAGLVAAGLVWAPFVLADVHGFLAAGKGIQTVQAWSVPWLLGSAADSAYPDWVRPVQLLLGVAVCWRLARRGSPAAGLLAAFALRTVLEPGTWWAYSSFLLALVVLLPKWRYAAALLAAGSWWFAHWWGGINAPNGVARLACLAGLIAVAAWSSAPNVRSERRREVTTALPALHSSTP